MLCICNFDLLKEITGKCGPLREKFADCWFISFEGSFYQQSLDSQFHCRAANVIMNDKNLR